MSNKADHQNFPAQQEILARRNKVFFLEWEFVVLKVENQLFRIPKHCLVEQSQFFGDLFSLPQSQSQACEVEGSSEANPIVFPPDIKAEDFQCFLKLVVPLRVQGPNPPKQLLRLAEWITILNLSTMWRCLGLRARAITQVFESRPSPIEQIQLGRQYFVSSWVVSGFRALVMRKEIITEEEAATIGLIEAFRLMCIRESRFSDMDAAIKKWFKEELESIGANEREYSCEDGI